jgi:dipeptidyl-peptidase-3
MRFEDSKVIPRCPEKMFKVYSATSTEAKAYHETTKGDIFSSNERGLCIWDFWMMAL